MDLQDKRALITGGTSGMGIAVALSMAEKGRVATSWADAAIASVGR